MDGDGDQSYSKGIKSIWRSFEIIEIIKSESPIRATAITERVDCSQTTVHYHLKTLQDCGYLIRGDQGYSLGMRFLHLGGHSLVSRDLYQALQNSVPTLAMDVGASVQVAVEEYGKGYYVEHVSGKDSSRTTRHVGTEIFLHSTAAGKAILSEFDSERVDEVVEQHGLSEFTDNTLTGRDALGDELRQIRESGVAYEVQEFVTDESGIAVPLVNGADVVGAIELTLPPTRIPDPRHSSKEERFPAELVERVEQAAQNIEARLEE